ncbi:MAG: TIGR00645 family protein [Hyphomicrobiaceae bacterium]
MDQETGRRVIRRLELGVEQFLFASRWVLAPFYLGLALAIIILLIKFIEEFAHIALTAFTASEADIILGVLSLVDLTLTASLLVIVTFSGYENFVSKIDHANHRDWPEWMGTIDFAALKLKLMSSIVAISAIQLLKQFMAVKGASDRDLWWYVVIHIVFVVSGVLLALTDRISGDHHAPSPPAKPADAGTSETHHTS